MTAIVRASPRDRWLARRRDLVTASDVAAILQLDPWRGPLAVYASKVGAAEQHDTQWLRRGRRMEPIVAADYAEATGRPVYATDPYEIRIHPDIPWLGATLDGETEGCAQLPAPATGRAPLELKTYGRQHALGWEGGGVPQAYEAQLQIQMAVTGASWGCLAALGSLDQEAPDVRDRLPHDRFLLLAIPILDAFRLRVLRRDPPEADRLPGTAAAIRRLWADEDGETVPLDHEALGLADRLAVAQARLSEAAEEADELDAMLRRRMASASFGALPDGSFLRLTTVERKGYTVEPSTHRQLRRWWPRLKGGRER